MGCLLVGCAGIQIRITVRRLRDATRITQAAATAVVAAGATTRVGRSSRSEVVVLTTTPTSPNHAKELMRTAAALHIGYEMLVDTNASMHPTIDITWPGGSDKSEAETETELLIAAAASTMDDSDIPLVSVDHTSNSPGSPVHPPPTMSAPSSSSSADAPVPAPAAAAAAAAASPAPATSAPARKGAILVIDLEVSGHGRKKGANFILGGAMVVIELGQAEAMAKVTSVGHFTGSDDLEELIPKENRFCEFIHDRSALNQIDRFLEEEAMPKEKKSWVPGWEEIEGKEFWLAPKNRDMLLRTVADMRASEIGPMEFATAAHAWMRKMADKYGDLLLLSDTSNFDWAWLDHYLHVHGGYASVNYATNNGFVIPLDATSYFFGLTKQPLSFGAWDNFSSKRALTDADFALPDTSHAIDPDSHDPLDDAINIAVRFASIVHQLKETDESGSKKQKRDA